MQQELQKPAEAELAGTAEPVFQSPPQAITNVEDASRDVRIELSSMNITSFNNGSPVDDLINPVTLSPVIAAEC